jgi:Protein of unknown function (DUF3182)
VACAVTYDAATAELRGFLASRRNYDVIVGVDGRGRRRLGVLEVFPQLFPASEFTEVYYVTVVVTALVVLGLAMELKAGPYLGRHPVADGPAGQDGAVG